MSHDGNCGVPASTAYLPNYLHIDSRCITCYSQNLLSCDEGLYVGLQLSAAAWLSLSETDTCTLQALQKAEEQRSSLQMALDSRHPPSDAPESSTSPTEQPARDPGSRSAAERISELEFEIRMIRTDLTHAQEAQIKAQSWYLQFKAMAQASDEACAAFQVGHRLLYWC